MKTVNLSQGIKIRFFPADKFKTTFLTFNIYTRCQESDAALCAFLPQIISCGYPEFDSLSALNKYLDSLYGAQLFGTLSKCGDLREIKLGFRGLKSKYTGDTAIEKLAELLLKLIFGVKEQDSIDKGIFDRELNIFNQNRLAEENEKRKFARSRAEEETCKDEPFGISLLGSDEAVACITPKSVTLKLKEILSSADIIINVVGAESEEKLTEIFKTNLEKITRDYKGGGENIIKGANGVREVTDTQNISQSKLVLSFRTSSPDFQNEAGASRLLTDIFGGGPYSKLFNNVREKKSLCYYCSARAVRNKGLIFVESGVDTANTEKAKEAIVAEFCDMKKGKITETELDYSKKGMTDFLMSISDEETLVERWYSLEGTKENVQSPEEVLSAIKNTTIEEISALAKTFSLDTVYLLKPNEVK